MENIGRVTDKKHLVLYNKYVKTASKYCSGIFCRNLVFLATDVRDSVRFTRSIVQAKDNDIIETDENTNWVEWVIVQNCQYVWMNFIVKVVGCILKTDNHINHTNLLF